MSNFATAMTTNNALSLSSPDPSEKTSGRIGLFFKAVRGLSVSDLEKYLFQASEESLVDTCALVFHLRDCRQGKGERALGRVAFRWLMERSCTTMINLIKYIPEYGRWDDLFSVWPGAYPTLCDLTPVVRLVSNQLKQDLADMNNGKPISLCAKWVPSENSSLDKKYNVVDILCLDLKINRKEYRKKYITPLRSYLKIVEKYMCEKRWDEIEFNQVPSCAMKRLKKAFEKHTPETFREWRSKLQSGETKVNAKVLAPHEICAQLKRARVLDEVCEAQWKVLEEQVRKNLKLSSILVVVDVSGSMCDWPCQTNKSRDLSGFLPVDVSCALGLLISGAVKGEFRNHVITFHEQPTFQVIPDGTLFDRLSAIRRIPWGSNTNFQAIFDMILERGSSANLSQKDMPENILVISDMQFDQANHGNTMTNFEQVDAKYKQSGYTRPGIIFWNVCAGHNDFPVTVSDHGTAMISGFSPAILNAFLDGKGYDPYSIMRVTIDSERYKPITDAIN